LNLDPDTVHIQILSVLAEHYSRLTTVYSRQAQEVSLQEPSFRLVPPKLLQRHETSLVWDQHPAVGMLAREGHD
jgi:hypothetical protein